MKDSKRVYALVEYRGEIKIAMKDEHEWIIDRTCKHINSLMKSGKLSVAEVRNWLVNDSSEHIH